MDQRGCSSNRRRVRQAAIRTGIGLVIALIALTVNLRHAHASEPPPDSACRLCHIGSDKEMVLPSGETLAVGVDATVLDGSVHGSHQLISVHCTDCHRGRERYLYPHQPNPAQTLQAFEADVAQNCAQCHPSSASHNPGHLGAPDNPDVPSCVDCHGGHAAGPAAEFSRDPIAFCQSCHQEYTHPQVAQAHQELAAGLQPGQDCQTCHNNQPLFPADAQCKTCHSIMQGEKTLESGETISLHVELAQLKGSVHGDRQVVDHQYSALLCTDCHADQQRYGFPHAELTADDARHLSLQMDQICQSCHSEIFARQGDSVHAKAQQDGTLAAATCMDCHGNHNIQTPDEPREHVSETCAQCHSTINAQYETSVHGAALLGEHNPDVPVCTDCHGVHDIHDPTTASFRANSPTLCGGCHANQEMMAKYDISTNVFDTYVADFHGTTVELFEKQSPDHETNKAVCYDCHGIHNILPVSDENSQVIRENLLATCRQCHPDADANFPDAWTSHFEPSLEHNPLVYLVNWFYRLLIPAVLGGFALFIGTDVFRLARQRLSRKGDRHGAA